jgi:hypothetical protein
MKSAMLIILLLVLSAFTWAVDANDFLIGAYSQYQIRYAGSNYAENFDSLGVYLNNSGFNAAVYGAAQDYSNNMNYSYRIPTIMQWFENSSIKSMLFDNSWYPSSGKIGVSTLTFGNWLQIEAEYQL